MLKIMKNLVVQEEGQALTEYGLIIGLVAVACVTALGLLKGGITDLLTEVGSKLTNAN